MKERSVPTVIMQEMCSLSVFFLFAVLAQGQLSCGRQGWKSWTVMRNLGVTSRLAAAGNKPVHEEMRQRQTDTAQTPAGEKNSLSSCECGSPGPSGCQVPQGYPRLSS